MSGKLLLVFLAGCFLCTAEKYVSLERDQNFENLEVNGWKMLQKVEPEKKLKLTFALKQRNIVELEKILADVSDPDSSMYGKYLKVQQITNLISPSRKTQSIVKGWLGKYGVTDCDVTQNKDFVICSVPCKVAEEMLIGAVFYYFYHQDVEKLAIRSPSAYYVPDYVSEHLDFVGGLHRLHPVSKYSKKDNNISKHKIQEKKTTRHDSVSKPGVHIGVYPSVLRKRYNISSNVGSHPNNSQAVAQFLEQYYSPADLKEFMYMFGSSFTHLNYISKVVGPDTGRSGIEASLDTQYIMSTGANISTWFWSTAGRHESQEPFLTWMIDVGNTSEVPYVHSVSYGEAENTLSVSFMQRVNTEFMKAGVRGITILFASGDDGAGCKHNKFAPNFPASSPYVTSVGGTAFSNPFTTSGEYGYEISSGGFSDVFSQPSYQAEKVANYLSTSKDLPSEKYFNKTGRAYPDISAVSNHFWVVNNRVPVPGVAGTSASTPTVAGMISLLNDARLKNNKPVLGFLNPFLYKHAETLYDVTSGCNEGCLSGDKGFCAFQGWDPVTGNGTPNYEALVKTVLQ